MPSTEQPPIHRHEWDFETFSADKVETPYIGCEKVELSLCYLYEYARALWMQQNHAEDDSPKEWPGIGKLIDPVLKHFPVTPWLSIPKAERHQALEKAHAIRPQRPIVIDTTVAKLHTDTGYKSEVAEYAFDYSFTHYHTVPITIGLHHGIVDIQAAFVDWLRSFMPTNSLCREVQSGDHLNETLKSALKCLGAYRLQTACKRIDTAYEFSIRQRGGKEEQLPLIAKSTWSSAKRNAEQTLQHWLNPTQGFLTRYKVPKKLHTSLESVFDKTRGTEGMRFLLSSGAKMAAKHIRWARKVTDATPRQ